MGRPRLPMAKAKVEGKDDRSPSRFAGRSDPRVDQLGKPSPFLTGGAVTAWHMFKAEIPWLSASDRAIVEIACVIRGKLIDGQPVTMGEINCLRLAAGQMGGSPVDRSKVSASDDDVEDPTDKFFH
jgi:hypothetical protein